MKAYQVFKGDLDKYGKQYYELIATYLDKQQALWHCNQVARETPMHQEILEFNGWNQDNTYCSWSAVG